MSADRVFASWANPRRFSVAWGLAQYESLPLQRAMTRHESVAESDVENGGFREYTPVCPLL